MTIYTEKTAMEEDSNDQTTNFDDASEYDAFVKVPDSSIPNILTFYPEFDDDSSESTLTNSHKETYIRKEQQSKQQIVENKKTTTIKPLYPGFVLKPTHTHPVKQDISRRSYVIDPPSDTPDVELDSNGVDSEEEVEDTNTQMSSKDDSVAIDAVHTPVELTTNTAFALVCKARLETFNKLTDLTYHYFLLIVLLNQISY